MSQHNSEAFDPFGFGMDFTPQKMAHYGFVPDESGDVMGATGQLPTRREFMAAPSLLSNGPVEVDIPTFDIDIFDIVEEDSSLGEDNLEPLSTAVANDAAPTKAVVNEVLGAEGIYECPEPGTIESLHDLATPTRRLDLAEYGF